MVESGSVKSQLSKIPHNDLMFWSNLSVKAAIAVIEARGAEDLAAKAANAVLEAGRKRKPTSKSSLRSLATKVSVTLLEAGGSHGVAAAVVVAIMNSDRDEDDGESKSKRSDFSDSSLSSSPASLSKRTSPPSKTSKGKSSKPSHRRDPSGQKSNVSSDSPSKTTVRKQLREKESKIDLKRRALEEAELLNLQREREISERMAALDAATVAMLQKVNGGGGGGGEDSKSLPSGERGGPTTLRPTSPRRSRRSRGAARRPSLIPGKGGTDDSTPYVAPALAAQ